MTDNLEAILEAANGPTESDSGAATATNTSSLAELIDLVGKRLAITAANLAEIREILGGIATG